MTRPARLDDDIVDEWLADHRSWRCDGGHLVRDVRTRDYPSSVAIVNAQVPLAEALDHHPIITLGFRELRFELWTHDRGGLTSLDLDYAAGLDGLIADRFADDVV